MARRFAHALLLSVAVIALVVTQVAPLSAGVDEDDDDGPVGYTVGIGATMGEVDVCDFFELDLKTGDATRVNSVLVPCADGLTFHEDGTLYAYRSGSERGASQAELITIDLDDGDQHFVRLLPTIPVGAGGMTFDEDGDLWLYGLTFGTAPCTPGRYCLWEIDPDNAENRFRGEAPPGTGVFGLTGDCEEDVIAITSTFGLGFAGLNAALAEVHTSNGALEPIVNLPGIEFPTGLDFEDDGDLWALGVSGLGSGAGIGATLFRVDPDDGSSQAKDVTIGGAPFSGTMNGLAIDPISCEEPDPDPEPVPPAPVVVEPVFTG